MFIHETYEKTIVSRATLTEAIQWSVIYCLNFFKKD